MPIAVCILDECRVSGEALAAMIAREPEYRLVPHDGPSADVVLVAARGTAEEIHLRVRRAAERFAGAAIILVGLDESCADCVALVESGACGWIQRNESVGALHEAIRMAAQSEARCPSVIVGRVARRVAELARLPMTFPRSVNLTARERDVLRLVGAGLSNKEVARETGTAMATVKNQVHALLRKFEASSRRDLVRRAMMLGLLQRVAESPMNPTVY